MKAIYPGTFDPFTNGHFNLVKRAAKVFEHVILAISSDGGKSTLFSLDERMKIAQRIIDDSGIKNISCISFNGLLADFASKQNVNVIVRGIRAISDFEYEFQMSAINKKLNESLETIFLPTDDNMHFISSKFVKNIAALGGDTSHFLHPIASLALHQKFSKNSGA